MFWYIFMDGSMFPWLPSMFWFVFMDGSMFSWLPSMFWCIFMDGSMFSRLPSMFWYIFMDGSMFSRLPSMFWCIFMDRNCCVLWELVFQSLWSAGCREDTTYDCVRRFPKPENTVSTKSYDLAACSHSLMQVMCGEYHCGSIFAAA